MVSYTSEEPAKCPKAPEEEGTILQTFVAPEESH